MQIYLLLKKKCNFTSYFTLGVIIGGVLVICMLRGKTTAIEDEVKLRLEQGLAEGEILRTKLADKIQQIRMLSQTHETATLEKQTCEADREALQLKLSDCTKQNSMLEKQTECDALQGRLAEQYQHIVALEEKHTETLRQVKCDTERETLQTKLLEKAGECKTLQEKISDQNHEIAKSLHALERIQQTEAALKQNMCDMERRNLQSSQTTTSKQIITCSPLKKK